jgi:S1-C subfamily serine protease
MTTKKKLATVVLVALSLATILAITMPSRSTPGQSEYDLWLDVNDDGKINIVDISQVAKLFGTTGTAINKTALLLDLQSEVQRLQAEIQALETQGTALSEIYQSAKDSVVLIVGTTSTGTVQGSGFVYNFGSSMFAITNNHVVHGTTSVSVTFSDGDGYAATVKGTDPYADLAVLLVTAPETEFKPIEIANSSSLSVGDSVIALGNPYGLVGSMTTGIVSALGRTITEDQYTGGYAIANIIQTSTPINPGNSGGPLLDHLGRVVGITTAIVADSQGLGFAIPSNTLLKEIASLIDNGTYENHSYLGVSGRDMDYEQAQDLGINVTYGWRIGSVAPDGPADKAGLHIDDIIIGINGTRIRNGDEMSSYLEEKTLPGETIVLSVYRDDQTIEKTLVLGKRPPPSG